MWRFVLVLCLLQVRGELNLLTKPPSDGESTTNEDYYTTPVTSSVRKVKPLRGLSHGVSSGKITLTDSTLHISNFHFDGEAPNAHFLVGKGTISSASGTVVPGDPLRKYEGENLTLTLPQGLKIEDIEWLAVWSSDLDQNLGFVFLKKPRSPQTFPLAFKVTSGPVVLIDKKTLFVPAFRYGGGYKSVHFWVGNGSKPDSKGVAVPDETGSTATLHPYRGQNLYLRLPEGVTTDNIDYFGVWSEDGSLGHVNLKIQEPVPEALESEAGDTIRLPKCCPLDSIITAEGCGNGSAEFKPLIDVYEHNETHFNNVSLDLDAFYFEPYFYNVKCPEGKVFLDEKDEFAFLRNGSLLTRGAVMTGIFSQMDFCLETLEGEDFLRLFVCAPVKTQHAMMFFTYVTLTIISTLCFAGTFFLYYFWLKVDDIHKKCFTAYSAAMAVTFLSLTIVQLAYVEDAGCNVLGFLFQFSMIASFTLLAILCFDIYIIVKTIDRNVMKRLRIRWYIGVALAVPILSLFISLVRDQTPDVPNSFFKPQYQKNSCYFPEERQRSVFFYLPIVASIIVGFVYLGLTKMRIVNYERSKTLDALWLDNRMNFKFMFRKYWIITAVSCLWPVEIILQVYAPDSGILIAFEIIDASQGLIVLTLFVLNKESRKLILRRIEARRRQAEQLNKIGHEETCPMTNLNSGS